MTYNKTSGATAEDFASIHDGASTHYDIYGTHHLFPAWIQQFPYEIIDRVSSLELRREGERGIIVHQDQEDCHLPLSSFHPSVKLSNCAWQSAHSTTDSRLHVLLQLNQYARLARIFQRNAFVSHLLGSSSFLQTSKIMHNLNLVPPFLPLPSPPPPPHFSSPPEFSPRELS